MSKIFVLADDLTGANDTGAAIRSIGWDTVSLVDCQAGPPPNDCSCLCVNLDSRTLAEEAAYERVRRCVQEFRTGGELVYSKRIDSTLRGNLGAESDAMLDELFPDGAALIVPAFPRAGRSYYNDCVYVHGIPLSKTSVASDPKCPVTADSAFSLFCSQSERQCSLIGLGTVRAGPAVLYREIRIRLDKSIQNLIFEAETDEDIEIIAAAASQIDTPFIAVDPGAFTAKLVEKILGKCTVPPLPEHSFPGSKILAVIGSVNSVAKEQTRRLLDSPGTAHVILDVDLLLESSLSCRRELLRAEAELAQLGEAHDVLALLFSSSMPDRSISLEKYMLRSGRNIEELSRTINDRLAQLAAGQLLRGYGGVFTTGGDITLSVCRRLGCSSIRISDEIFPLAVGGILNVPAVGPLAVATKGGMVGGWAASCLCVTYLQNILKGRG